MQQFIADEMRQIRTSMPSSMASNYPTPGPSQIHLAQTPPYHFYQPRPPRTYQPPPHIYQTPPPTYPPPPHIYQTPPPTYQPPPYIYQPPPHIYQTPPPTYPPPPHIYQMPPPTYQIPPHIYQTPPPTYQPPPQIYQPPPHIYQTMQPPTYQPPPQIYQPPRPTYQPPPSIYQTPRPIYESQPQMYQTARLIYQPPQQFQYPAPYIDTRAPYTANERQQKLKVEVETINNEGDKFSNLPDPFFYRIISLLQLDDFARVATLSKRFRNRCLFNPSLEIDLSLHEAEEEIEEDNKLNEVQIFSEASYSSYSSYGSKTEDNKLNEDQISEASYSFYGSKTEEMSPPPEKNMYEEEERRSFFINVLDKVMTLRNKDRKSMKIRRSRFKAEEGVNVNGWIQTAAMCNVETIDIDLSLKKGECIEFPCCESLSVFELNLHDGTLKFPSEGFSSLQVLTLQSVRIVCEDFGALIFVSKCLKKLSLKNCFGVEKIEIESSSLREISIVKRSSDELKHIKVSANGLKIIYVAWYFRSSSDEKSFHLSAPSLRSLCWRGDSVNDCNLGSFNSLQDASINLRHPSMLTEYQTSMEEAPIEDRLIELIKSVRGVKVLELNCWHIEGFVEHNRQPTSLDNVEDLVLNVSVVKKDRQVAAILKFLKQLPNLQTLNIKDCRQPWGWGANLGKPMVLDTSSCQWISHLKFVNIELTGGGDEIELIEYLSKYAKELKKMIILYHQVLDVHRLSELSNKIKRAHSRGVVMFIPFS